MAKYKTHPIIPAAGCYNTFVIEEKYGLIVVRDASRRTTKANVFCTGIGNRKISPVTRQKPERLFIRQ